MTTQIQLTPMAAALAALSDSNVAPDKFKAWLEVRREFMADEAAQAFNAAVVQFQQRAKIVAKLDTANGRAYARMDRLWREIRPLMEECGLAVTWESVKSTADTVTLDGHLRHRQGHAQPLHHEMPMPDKLNGQNAAQRAGSGETYAKRYATMAALGLQTGDDDDGRGGVSTPSTPDKVREFRALLAAKGKPEKGACDYLGIDKLEDAPADKLSALHATIARLPDVKHNTKE
jgi:hypothetical protein